MERALGNQSDHRRELSDGQRTRTIQRVLVTVLVLNLAVALVKLIYGQLSNSLSMTADGLNSLMDGASNVIGLFAIAVAARPPDPNHPYGHRRFETLTSLGIAMFMLLALEQILRETWNHWQTGARPEVTTISFVIMIGTLIVNIGVTIWERRTGNRLRSSVLTADAQHTASNALVSISVIAGLIVTRLGYPQADLFIALIVAAVIAYGAWTIIRDAALTLSDVAAAPASEIERVARSVLGVEGVHNVRTRDGEGVIWVDLHIQVDPELRVDRAHDIASAVAARVERELDVPADVTVHVEPADMAHLGPERGHNPWR